MNAALTKEGLDPAKFHPWFEDWTGVEHRIFEAAIGNGKWIESDFNDGVHDGGGEANVIAADASTITLADPDNGCQIVMQLSKSGSDQLTMKVQDDACGADDLPLETAIYEASPFRLVEAAGWAAPAKTPAPSLGPSSVPATMGPSTSHDRLVQHLVGSVPGAKLGYLEYLPPGYTTTGAQSPLLVSLHGSGESGAGDELGLDVLASSAIPSLIAANEWPDERPFVVLAPQHDDRTPPSYCMEATEIDSFLHFALAHYNVDPARVYITGLSCGAIGLWNYLAEHGNELVAAAVPIAGNGVGAIEQRGCALGRTPIWAFHGFNDPNVPVHGDVYPLTVLQHCTDPAPADARVTVFPLDGHDVWTRTYNMANGYDIYSWMLSHTNGS